MQSVARLKTLPAPVALARCAGCYFAAPGKLWHGGPCMGSLVRKRHPATRYCSTFAQQLRQQRRHAAVQSPKLAQLLLAGTSKSLQLEPMLRCLRLRDLSALSHRLSATAHFIAAALALSWLFDALPVSISTIRVSVRYPEGRPGRRSFCWRQLLLSSRFRYSSQRDTVVTLHFHGRAGFGRCRVARIAAKGAAVQRRFQALPWIQRARIWGSRAAHPHLL